MLPALDTSKAGSCLLKISADAKGRVVLGSQACGNSEGVAKSQVGVLLIP